MLPLEMVPERMRVSAALREKWPYQAPETGVEEMPTLEKGKCKADAEVRRLTFQGSGMALGFDYGGCLY